MDPDALFDRISRGVIGISIELGANTEEERGPEAEARPEEARPEETSSEEGSTEEEDGTQEEEVDTKEKVKPIQLPGLIIEWSTHSIYIIADGQLFMGMIGVKPIFIHFHGVKKLCHSERIHIENGIAGIRCDFDDETDFTFAQKIEMCDQPVRMSEPVHVYDGVDRRLTPGVVTGIERFGRHRFSVNCNRTYHAGVGGLVINKDGKMIGMCCSAAYHLTARSTSAVLATVNTMRDVLYPN